MIDLYNDPGALLLLLCKNIGYRHLNYILLTVFILTVGHAISAMGNKLMSGVFRGRPYGGVAFLWRKSVANRMRVISYEEAGRCLYVALNYD